MVVCPRYRSGTVRTTRHSAEHTDTTTTSAFNTTSSRGLCRISVAALHVQYRHGAPVDCHTCRKRATIWMRASAATTPPPL